MPLTVAADRALNDLATASGSSALTGLDAQQLLMERAWLNQAIAGSRRSTSGKTCLLDTCDGIVAVAMTLCVAQSGGSHGDAPLFGHSVVNGEEGRRRRAGGGEGQGDAEAFVLGQRSNRSQF